MKYRDTDIKLLTNKQLVDAEFDLNIMHQNRNDKLANKRERHKSFNFDHSNPVFEQLKTEIASEIKARGI